MRLHQACRAAIVLLLTLAVFSPPAAASERLEFRLPGSHGYEVRVRAQGSTAFVTVGREFRKGDSGAAESAYITRARTSATNLKASFGDLGRVAMRFHPSGKVARGSPRRRCRGPDRYTTRFGVFAGSFRFKGENGYTQVQVHRVRGTVVSPAILYCRRFRGFAPRRNAAIWRALPSPPQAITGPFDPNTTASARALLGGSPAKLTLLDASWRLGVAAQGFAALKVGNRGALYLASSLATDRRLAIFRLALAVDSQPSFFVDDSLSRAGVSPPAPFSGSGTFEHFDDGSKSWTGTLAISFPGAPDVPLVGSPFEPVLRRGL